MANTQHAHKEDDSNVTTVHGATDADIKAWCEAAKARKYRVHPENDPAAMPYGYGSEMIFPLPAPVGFAALHPGFRPIAFQAIAQMMVNRIGQTQDGNVSAKIAACLATGDGSPGAQTNDAFDTAYRDRIAELVEAKLGDYTKDENGAELRGEALKLAKATRDRIMFASANSENNKAKYFEATVKAAVARGTDKSTSGKAKRVAKATTGGMDL